MSTSRKTIGADTEIAGVEATALGSDAAVTEKIDRSNPLA